MERGLALGDSECWDQRPPDTSFVMHYELHREYVKQLSGLSPDVPDILR